ncbi:MAG: outer envelope protein [Rhodocyclales bacterium]|nr:outer envelope protein [Rhodocyclales bacterium]
MRTFKKSCISAVIGAMLLVSAGVQAAEWSDTYIGYRYGTKFAEPFGATDISKDIINLSHVSGYKYGTNFLNVDLLFSDSKDPSAPNSSSGAQEIYMVYRNTLDFGKVAGKDLGWGPFSGFGFTAGFDANSKNDAGYNSKKRMVVAGPTIMFKVPGFLSVSVLELWESNSPYNKFSGIQTRRYSYDPHPMLTAAWGIPFSIGPVALSFEGFFNFISAKGKNEFGGGTAPETNFDAQIMYDVAPITGLPKNTLKIGYEYQYWHNKFGNSHKGPAGPGALANTSMIRAEYHF